VGAALLLGLSLFVLQRWQMTTDIADFLPGGEAGTQAALARQIAVSELSRTMVLLVTLDGGDREGTAAAAVSSEMERALRAEAADALAAIDAGPAEGFEDAVWRLYEPRVLAFSAASADAARAATSPMALAAAVEQLKRKLASPMSSLLARVAPRDPLLVLPRVFEQAMGKSGAGLAVVDGRFVTADGQSAVLFLVSRTAASDSATQRPLLAAIQRAFATVDAGHGGRLQLRQCGTNRHAVGTEDAMRADVQRVSLGSFLGMLVLVALFGPRRLPRTPWLAKGARLLAPLKLPLSWLPVLAMGFLVGAATCLLAFGRVHGLTLAFGASLIGVSIDYAVHFYCHASIAPSEAGARATLRRIWPSLVLGAATTVVGFVVLLLATFPGLREMALFAASGLAASLLATWLFLPALADNVKTTRLGDGLGATMELAHAWRGRRRLWLWAPVVVAAAVTVIGLPAARWNDGVATLNRVDPVLAAEDRAVLQQVAQMEQRRVVMAIGADDEAALTANDAVAEVLAEAQARGDLGGFRSLAALLPSAGRQLEVDAALRGDRGLWDRLRAALTAAGFVAEAFEPFRATLASPPPPPLTYADLAASPLAAMVRPFRLALQDGRVAFLTFVHDLGAPAAARLATVPGATVVDIEAALTGALASYRQRMTSLLAVGLLLVVALVAVRYRRLRSVVLACAPALLGAATTVAALSLLGVDLNLLSLVALLMIVSMGVDYGIFLADDGGDGRARRATQIGVLIDGLTTVLGFGLLAASPQPALFRIGITSGIGVCSCLLLALAIGALATPREELARHGPDVG